MGDGRSGKGKEAQSSKVKAQKVWTSTTFPVGDSHSPSVGFSPICHLPDAHPFRPSALGVRPSTQVPGSFSPYRLSELGFFSTFPVGGLGAQPDCIFSYEN